MVSEVPIGLTWSSSKECNAYRKRSYAAIYALKSAHPCLLSAPSFPPRPQAWDETNAHEFDNHMPLLVDVCGMGGTERVGSSRMNSDNVKV